MKYTMGISLRVLFAKDNGSFLLLGRKCTAQEILELVECGDSTAWCLGQPEHPIKVKEFGNSSGRSQLFRIEEESHKMIQTMDSYSA